MPAGSSTSAGDQECSALNGPDIGDLGPLEDGCNIRLPRPSIAMSLPTEMIQHIYSYLTPADFHSARRTCRSWFDAGFSPLILTWMLRRGGWWSSAKAILTPLSDGEYYQRQDTAIMSRWVSRECALSSVSSHTFTEVGHTSFSQLVPFLAAEAPYGEMVFTASLYGRFILAAVGKIVYVYEMNHVCSEEERKWSRPRRQRGDFPRGSLRPVTVIHCERRVLSCSMDTSRGRNSVAILMEGRLGFVCDILPTRLGISTGSTRSLSFTAFDSTPQEMENTGSKSSCICRAVPVHRSPLVQASASSVYRSICFPDDPPRSVALHPQRHCIAFRCSGGIELYWTDAVRGTHLSRWFPLASPSDYLYFMPPRAGVDTAKRLRLIGSAIALESPLESFGNIVHGLNPTIYGSRSASTVPLAGSDPSGPPERPGYPEDAAPRRVAPMPHPRGQREQLRVRSLGSNSVYHYRAVPLSDGYHILFTDPWSGNLCLGTDAPVGSLTRLIRKVWFSPPKEAASTAPILYASGADLRHGVRIVATFAARDDGDGEPQGPGRASPTSDGAANSPTGNSTATSISSKQIIVFYSIPPDMFHDITQGYLAGIAPAAWRVTRRSDKLSDWAAWWEETARPRSDPSSDQYYNSGDYPIEVPGQCVATCDELVEIALESSPDMAIWAFGADGWAKTWMIANSMPFPYSRSAVQRDGSLRYMDGDGDISIPDTGSAESEDEAPEPAPFDGPPSQVPRTSQPLPAGRGSMGPMMDRMSWTVSVDVMEQATGIMRVNVELR